MFCQEFQIVLVLSVIEVSHRSRTNLKYDNGMRKNQRSFYPIAIGLELPLPYYNEEKRNTISRT